jgi:dihydroorotate dehydrogenase
MPVGERRLSVGSGGLSGRALLDGTLTNLREIRRSTGGAVPLNASGGIFTGEDALACIEAGATTVQVYTGLVFEGPGIVGGLTRALASALRSRRADLAALVESN